MGHRAHEEAPASKRVYENVFPRLPGSYDQHLMHSPALALVKTVVRVLRVHHEIESTPPARAFFGCLHHKIH